MERSHLPLLKWFRAITAIWKKPELSIKELQRQMKITYKTAWSINHRIRKAIRACDGNPEKLFSRIARRKSQRSTEIDR